MPGFFESERWQLRMAEAFEKCGNPSRQSYAEAFRRFYRNIFAYDWESGCWWRYSVTQWVKAPTIIPSIAEFMKSAVSQDGGTASDEKQWLTASTFIAIESILRGTMTARWNESENLLPFTNGYALNLEDGQIDPIYPAQHLNRCLPSGVIGNLDTPSKRWEAFVFECLAHYNMIDQFAIAKCLQQWCGAALTGDVSNSVMLFLYGRPGSGKSTFVETLRAVFGDYAASVSGSRVARENGHSQWLAGLQGKRLVVINELPSAASGRLIRSMTSFPANTLKPTA